MTPLVELTSAPIDADGMLIWSNELDAKAAPKLTGRNIVAVVFLLNGDRTVGFVGWRVMHGRVSSWNVRIFAIPRPDGRVALSAWCSSRIKRGADDEAFLDLQWPRHAQLSGTFDRRADAIRAVQTWAAELDEASEDFPEPSMKDWDTSGPDRSSGLLREEDIESFLEEMDRSARRANDVSPTE